MSQKPLFGDNDLPTTTVHQSRMQIFQPTRRPKNLIRNIITPWGEGRIHGKIGQAHADVIEAIFHQADRFRVIEDPEAGPDRPNKIIEILVDPHKIRMTAGGGKKMSGTQLDVLKIELQQVVIELSGNVTFRPVTGHIIDEIVISTIEASGEQKGFNQGEKRYLWYVKIGGAFTRFLSEDLHLHYDPLPIAGLNAGITQAVVRHILTHRNEPNGGWKIDELIKVVGAGESSVAMQNRRRELKGDAEGMKKIGLNIENGRITKLPKF